MTRRRFFAPLDSFEMNCSKVTLAAEEARHLLDVLRLNRGDEVFVFDGDGREFRCTVDETSVPGMLAEAVCCVIAITRAPVDTATP